jgi:hypothetical protein
VPQVFGAPTFLLVMTLAQAAPPVDLGGATIQAPEGFRQVSARGLEASEALAPSSRPGIARTFASALVDGRGPGSSAMTVTWVAEPISVHDGARAAFVEAVTRHFHEELELGVVVERSAVVAGPAPRLQVEAAVTQAGETRKLLIAALPAGDRHAVVTFSVLPVRWPAQEPLLKASLDTFRAHRARSPGWFAGAAGAVVLSVAAALAIWLVRQRGRPASAPADP